MTKENIHYDKVLLVGSGLAAPLAADWDMDGWLVCVIHNAWKAIPDRWDILLHAMDFPNERKPVDLKPDQKLIMTYDWIRESFDKDRHGGFWRNHCGYGKTMFFSSFWWIMEHYTPRVFGFLCCDMYYPDAELPDGKCTFYGKGSPDPLKYNHQALLHWLGFLDGFCCRDDVMCINYTPYGTPTLLPFSHGIFPEKKPVERGREHRTTIEYYPKVIATDIQSEEANLEKCQTFSNTKNIGKIRVCCDFNIETG